MAEVWRHQFYVDVAGEITLLAALDEDTLQPCQTLLGEGFGHALIDLGVKLLHIVHQAPLRHVPSAEYLEKTCQHHLQNIVADIGTLLEHPVHLLAMMHYALIEQLATSSILTDLMPKVMITRQTWSNIFSRCVVMLYTVSGCKCIQENLKNKKVLLFLSFMQFCGLVPPSAENGRRSDPAPMSCAIPCIRTTYTYWTVVGTAGSTPRQPSAGREKPSAKGQQYSF